MEHRKQRLPNFFGRCEHDPVMFPNFFRLNHPILSPSILTQVDLQVFFPPVSLTRRHVQCWELDAALLRKVVHLGFQDMYLRSAGNFLHPAISKMKALHLMIDQILQVALQDYGLPAKNHTNSIMYILLACKCVNTFTLGEGVIGVFSICLLRMCLPCLPSLNKKVSKHRVLYNLEQSSQGIQPTPYHIYSYIQIILWILGPN